MNGQVVYDADCGFCTRVAHWADHDPVSWQALDLAAVGATPEQADNFAGWHRFPGGTQACRTDQPR